MDRIGVRELRQNASVYLERVKDGESIEITQRGVPIAVLSPSPATSTYDRLVAEGTLIPAKSSLVEWLKDHPPAPAVPGEPTLGEVLQQLRDDEYR